MKPERIQFAPELPTISTANRGVYQTFSFETRSKAENFTSFAQDMADNHGLVVNCLTHPRTFDTRVLVETVPDAESGQPQPMIGAWQFLDKVEAIHKAWSSPAEAS